MTVASPSSSTVNICFVRQATKMHDLQTLQSGGYNDQGLTRLKLTCPLESFPLEILELGQTLEHLDLSGTGLSSLPTGFGSSLPHLRIAFFSQCAFSTFPRELAACSQLEMVAFRGNGITDIPEDALPPRLRWLIMTDNKLNSLPKSIGKCGRLQKCILAGNQLQSLPDEMRECKKLGLLRLSANKMDALPEWLFSMPELAFLSFAGNPCSRPLAQNGKALNGTTDPNGSAHMNGNGSAAKKTIHSPNEKPHANGDSKTKLTQVAWSDLEVQHTLGEGASGIISKGLWQIDPETKKEVAIKLFRGSLTSDGTPQDEMAAVIAAGQHDNIIDVLGRIHDHPDEATGSFKGGLVMQLIPPHYHTLGQPPSMQSCTRDTYPVDAQLSLGNALNILAGIAAAAAHLHSRGISHGDLYAHNILTNDEGHALLGDFGAATVHSRRVSPLLEKLEVLAFAHLVEDVVGLIPADENVQVVDMLQGLRFRCSDSEVHTRPDFDEVIKELRLTKALHL